MNGQCYEALLPFTLRQAQGERKRTLGIVFPGCHPSTGSGRTEAHFGDRLPWQFTLRQAQGERKRTLGIVFPGCSPFDRLRANGSAFWGSSSLAVHPATGSGRTEAHFGDRLSRLFTLRQAQGERNYARNSPSRRFAREIALSDIAQKPSVALPKSPLRMPLDGLTDRAEGVAGHFLPKEKYAPCGSSRLDYCDLSAVDHEGVAGYVATEIASQEHRAVCHLFRFAYPPERNALQIFVDPSLVGDALYL